MVEKSVKKFIEAAKKWNREVFGNILKRKHTILAQLNGIQRRMEKYRSKKLIDLEKELQIELESVLDNEELIWKQKSRSNWLTLGDRNTKYFHFQANNSRPVNQINALKLEGGMWCYEDERLKYEAISFYQRLYTNEKGNMGRFLVRRMFPTVEAEFLEALD